MDLYTLFEWFEATWPATVVRESLWLFPVIESVHLLALALLGGSILVVDLRLLGLGLTGKPIPEVARSASPWLRLAVGVMLGTGVLMFLSEAIKCYYSPPFWYKMSFLAAALLFTFGVRARLTRTDPGTLQSRLTAVISMGLWFGVGFAGRWIAFY